MKLAVKLANSRAFAFEPLDCNTCMAVKVGASTAIIASIAEEVTSVPIGSTVAGIEVRRIDSGREEE